MILFSGGASGTDMLFEQICDEFGIQMIAYSFDGHKTDSKHTFLLSNEQLHHAKEFVVRANQRLNRFSFFPSNNDYTNKLIERDYYIVKYATIIIAFGYLDLSKPDDKVNGGTAWGIEMAKFKMTPIYFFDLSEYKWYSWLYDRSNQYIHNIRPILKKNDKIAGIGTRRVRFHTQKIISEIKILVNNDNANLSKGLSG